jgi:hypothetical protein
MSCVLVSGFCFSSFFASSLVLKVAPRKKRTSRKLNGANFGPYHAEENLFSDIGSDSTPESYFLIPKAGCALVLLFKHQPAFGFWADGCPYVGWRRLCIVSGEREGKGSREGGSWLNWSDVVILSVHVSRILYASSYFMQIAGSLVFGKAVFVFSPLPALAPDLMCLCMLETPGGAPSFAWAHTKASQRCRMGSMSPLSTCASAHFLLSQLIFSQDLSRAATCRVPNAVLDGSPTTPASPNLAPYYVVPSLASTDPQLSVPTLVLMARNWPQRQKGLGHLLLCPCMHHMLYHLLQRRPWIGYPVTRQRLTRPE